MNKSKKRRENEKEMRVGHENDICEQNKSENWSKDGIGIECYDIKWKLRKRIKMLKKGKMEKAVERKENIKR